MKIELSVISILFVLSLIFNFITPIFILISVLLFYYKLYILNKKLSVLDKRDEVIVTDIKILGENQEKLVKFIKDYKMLAEVQKKLVETVKKLAQDRKNTSTNTKTNVDSQSFIERMKSLNERENLLKL